MEGRRTNRIKRALGALSVALVIGAAAFALVSLIGSNGADANPTKAGGIRYAPGGVTEEGLTLGKPDAPVDLYEYCDLESPICRQFATAVLPQVIRDEVDTGKARVTFRNFTIMGAGSPAAAAAAVAAGEQDVGWSFVEAFYRRRETRDAGPATDAFLEATAAAAGVRDLARWNAARTGGAAQAKVNREHQGGRRARPDRHAVLRGQGAGRRRPARRGRTRPDPSDLRDRHRPRPGDRRSRRLRRRDARGQRGTTPVRSAPSPASASPTMVGSRPPCRKGRRPRASRSPAPLPDRRAPSPPSGASDRPPPSGARS